MPAGSRSIFWPLTSTSSRKPAKPTKPPPPAATASSRPSSRPEAPGRLTRSFHLRAHLGFGLRAPAAAVELLEDRSVGDGEYRPLIDFSRRGAGTWPCWGR